MKLTGIAAAAALMLPAAFAPAYALCPGGADNPPLCVTGLPTWIGSGSDCERYEVAGVLYGIDYSLTDPEVAAGFRSGLDRNISVSVKTGGQTSSTCKDGKTYYVISSVKNALSN